MVYKIFIVILLFGGLGYAWGAIAAPIGTVIKIYDGDTVQIIGKGRKLFIARLVGMDAPEHGQAYSEESRRELARLIYKKAPRVVYHGKDRHGRTLVRLYMGKVDVSKVMIERGAAWVYRRYTREAALYKAEALAKSEKRGLWAARNPIAPWTYRNGTEN